MTPQRVTRVRASRGASRGGFTLIEVLLVLIILVIIGSLAANVFIGTQDRANKDAARSNLTLMRGQIDLYHLHMGKYPTKLEELWEEPSDKTAADKWSGPYVEKLKPDPWGNEYQYTAQGKKNTKKYDLWSNGPDGQNGTDDDIGNWE